VIDGVRMTEAALEGLTREAVEQVAPARLAQLRATLEAWAALCRRVEANRVAAVKWGSSAERIGVRRVPERR
jgi:hypothetical protein